MRTVNPEMIRRFEYEIGESLLDSNEWSSNPFTILGFCYGLSAFQSNYQYLHKHMQKLVDKNGYNTELFAPSVYEEAAYLQLEAEQTGADIEGADIVEKSEEIYYNFLTEVINTISVYNARWWATCESHGVEFHEHA